MHCSASITASPFIEVVGHAQLAVFCSLHDPSSDPRIESLLAASAAPTSADAKIAFLNAARENRDLISLGPFRLESAFPSSQHVLGSLSCSPQSPDREPCICHACFLTSPQFLVASSPTSLRSAPGHHHRLRQEPVHCTHRVFFAGALRAAAVHLI
jgi:hypothetical protein